LQALALLEESRNETDPLYEIISRSAERLGRFELENTLRHALAQMDQAAILTIHGFCQRLLQAHPLLFGIDFDFEVAEDVSSIYAELAVDFWVSELYDKPEWLMAALAEQRIDPENLAKLAQVAAMPGIQILGPEPKNIDEELFERGLALRRRTGQLWAKHRDAILEILTHHEGLNRQSYKRETIESKWVPALDSFFDGARFQSPPGFFSKLAQERMAIKKGFEEPTHPFFDACAELWEVHQQIRPILEYAVFSFQERFIEFVRGHARRRRNEAAVLSYDDLLTTVYAPLDPCRKNDPSLDRDSIASTISKAYPLALVDEFQDTDSVQYGIFHAIYGDGSAVYVGDPKQAIYAFRGADVFSYMDAVMDVGERVHRLTRNRRSDPGMVRAVNALFSCRELPFALEGIAFEEAIPHERANRSSLDPSMEVILLDEKDLQGSLALAIAPTVANEIAHLLGSNARIDERLLGPGDVAVLCRSNNQAVEVTRALRALKIPASLDGDSSVLNTEIASDVRVVLEAASMPGDSPAVRRALLTPLLGVTPQELASMDDEHWSRWVSRFHAWSQMWHEQGVLRFLEDLLRSTGAETRIARRPSARRELTDLLHIEELLLRGERERHRDPIALAQWFRRLDRGSTDDGMVAYEDLQQRPDAEAGAVCVSTIHKSKGLEYGVVYCPFTWNDASLWSFERAALKFHDEQGNLKLDLGSDRQEAHARSSEREALSEAIRLLYVAVTRAKHRCTLFWGRAPTWKPSALAYVLLGDRGLSKPSEAEMRASLDALANASGGTVGWRSPTPARAPERQDEGPHAVLCTPEQVRLFELAPRIGSFTSMTGQNEKIPDPRADVPTAGAPPALFAELPGGARTGLLLHSILEVADFARLESSETGLLIERQLRAYGFDPSLAASIQRDLGAVGSTPLIPGPSSPRLIDLPRDRQLRELEFTLCVDRPALVSLAKLLRQYGAPEAAPGYHERLAEVSGQTLQRFLRGYIDLVFEWRGQWYIADYKSNLLSAYEPALITEAVQREHYLLQAQLYAAAAHRYLTQRLPQYEPERHWGGTLLLFLRGMRGPAHAGSSVFFDRQPAVLLRAVDRWLGGGRGSR
jgi:exodeoxyribonuclease V beta subunit